VTEAADKENQRIRKYYLTERGKFVDFIARFVAVESALDIGCAGGRLGSELIGTRVAKACDGIEPFPEAAALATAQLRHVWNGTLESVSDEVPWSSYDMVVMADVLEHLVDPWQALKFLRERTPLKCCLALSVPNVRHYKVSFPLLFMGKFRYADQGIMDRTHLHFFTRGSLAETLHECGWRIRAIDSSMKDHYRRAFVPTRWIEPFVTRQYYLIAEKQ
jgi:2-polyprenyl-3-methyl-5-hydroxy-6-metoxy-1,4-benzoquinol methylase